MEKKTTRAIRTEISQRSLISSISFSIYIRFLFSEIKNEVKYANLKCRVLLMTLQSKSNQKAQHKIANY